MSAQFTTEYCREEWLRELTYYGKSHELGTSLKSYGYCAQYNYICLLISLSEVSYQHSIQLEMDLHSARNFLNRILTIENASTLSFIDFPSVIIFVPWNRTSDIVDFKEYLSPILLRLNHELLQRNWEASIGTIAHTLSDFQTSYLHAQKTAHITTALQIQDQIHFYNDIGTCIYYFYVVPNMYCTNK